MYFDTEEGLRRLNMLIDDTAPYYVVLNEHHIYQPTIRIYGPDRPGRLNRKELNCELNKRYVHAKKHFIKITGINSIIIIPCMDLGDVKRILQRLMNYILDCYKSAPKDERMYTSLHSLVKVLKEFDIEVPLQVFEDDIKIKIQILKNDIENTKELYEDRKENLIDLEEELEEFQDNMKKK